MGWGSGIGKRGYKRRKTDFFFFAFVFVFFFGGGEGGEGGGKKLNGSLKHLKYKDC